MIFDCLLLVFHNTIIRDIEITINYFVYQIIIGPVPYEFIAVIVSQAKAVK